METNKLIVNVFGDGKTFPVECWDVVFYGRSIHLRDEFGIEFDSYFYSNVESIKAI